jgi:hypothetical protein
VRYSPKVKVEAESPEETDLEIEDAERARPKASRVSYRCLVCGRTFQTQHGLKDRHLPKHPVKDVKAAVDRKVQGKPQPWEQSETAAPAEAGKKGAPKVKTAKKQPKAAKSPKASKKPAKAQPKAEDFVDMKATEWPGAAGAEVPEELRSAVNKLQWKVVNDNLKPARAAKAAKTRAAKKATPSKTVKGKASKTPSKKAAKPKAQPKAEASAKDLAKALMEVLANYA